MYVQVIGYRQKVLYWRTSAQFKAVIPVSYTHLEVPIVLQCMMWNMVDTMEVESKDYFQVFELSEYDGMQKICLLYTSFRRSEIASSDLFSPERLS